MSTSPGRNDTALFLGAYCCKHCEARADAPDGRTRVLHRPWCPWHPQNLARARNARERVS